MQYTIPCRKWDIVLVPFPFTDFRAFKRRPALIISPDDYNRKADIVITYITSHPGAEKRFGDYHIQEWEKANLPKPSLIRMKFATIDKAIIIKKLGRLQKKDREQFKKRLAEFFEKEEMEQD